MVYAEAEDVVPYLTLGSQNQIVVSDACDGLC